VKKLLLILCAGSAMFSVQAMSQKLSLEEGVAIAKATQEKLMEPAHATCVRFGDFECLKAFVEKSSGPIGKLTRAEEKFDISRHFVLFDERYIHCYRLALYKKTVSGLCLNIGTSLFDYVAENKYFLKRLSIDPFKERGHGAGTVLFLYTLFVAQRLANARGQHECTVVWQSFSSEDDSSEAQKKLNDFYIGLGGKLVDKELNLFAWHVLKSMNK